jgi:hypothetical protein
MKKLFFTLIVAGAAIGYGCNPGNNKASQKEENSVVSDTVATNDEKVDAESQPEKNNADAIVETTEAKAAAEMCSCVNASLKDMSPRVQQTIIRAGNSEKPLQVLQNEVVAFSDKEQDELLIQLQRFSDDPQLQNCSEKIGRKYGLNANDKASQEKLLQATKNSKDCELVHALIKISLQQQTEAGN